MTAAKREYTRIHVRGYRAGLRAAIHLALGQKCERCGETDPRVFTIDHRHGGGTEHRKNTKSDIAYLKEILRDIRTKKYRLLCANCDRLDQHYYRRPWSQKKNRHKPN